MISGNKTELSPQGGNPVAVEPPSRDDTVTQDAASMARAAELSSRDVVPPARVPGYAIARPLGEGAYGSVWLATERNTGKQVAIKFYSHRRGLDWSLLNREVEKLAVLYTSRNIVGLLEVGWNSDPPFYVMEYLENGSLAALLDDGSLPAQEAVRIARSVLQALVHAHGSGILHCDLKPANVLLDADYEPRLCDFGQSRLSDEQNPALGTLFYMAPEQADLHAVPDARWDVYALGALLYQMLTGEAPYRTPGHIERVRRAKTLELKLAEYRSILKHTPRPTAHRSLHGVDKRLADVVDRCLRINPEKRFPNAQAVLEALDERDRHRARRPLMVLGVVFPLILLVLLAPMANKASNEAVATATDTLSERAIESDVLSANIMARSMQRDLEDRRDELVRLTREVDLADMLERTRSNVLAEIDRRLQSEGAGLPAEQRTALWNRLKRETWDRKRNGRKQVFQVVEKLAVASNRRREQLGRSRDRSWFITDASGIQRWRYPVDVENTLDVRFNYRDYFHGHHTEYDKANTPAGLRPITEPHVSLAFRSVSTKKFMVAISVPIFERSRSGKPDKGRVVGILARTMDLGEMLADYSTGLKRRGRNEIARSVVLVENTDGKLLDHPWMTREHLDELQDRDRDLQSLTVADDVRKQLVALQRQRAALSAAQGPPTADSAEKPGRVDHYLADYTDPVGNIPLDSARAYGGQWLAAFAPVADTGWTVIVQERRNAALEPIDKIQDGLIDSGIRALVLFIGLIVAVWAIVVWRLSDRPLRSSRRNGWLKRSGPDRTTPRTATGNGNSS